MGTGLSPIAYALTDVGRSLRSVLEDEASRRDARLRSQQEMGKLTLQQAMLSNDAQRQAAQGQVSLAQVAAQGRQQERQGELEQQRLGLSRETLAETRAQHERTTALQQRELEQVKIPQQRATAGYYGAMGQEANERALDRRRDRARQDQPIFIEDAVGLFGTRLRSRLGYEAGSEAENESLALAESFFGDLNKYQVDRATGKHITTVGDIEPRAKAISTLLNLARTEEMTPQHEQAAIAATVKNMDLEQSGLSPEEALLMATTYVRNPKAYAQIIRETSQFEQELLRIEIGRWEQENRKKANSDVVKNLEAKVVKPIIRTSRLGKFADMVGGATRRPGGADPLRPMPLPPPAARTLPPDDAALQIREPGMFERASGTLGRAYRGIGDALGFFPELRP